MDATHKRKPLSDGRGPRSVCGQAGYITVYWKFVTCDECPKRRTR